MLTYNALFLLRGIRMEVYLRFVSYKITGIPYSATNVIHKLIADDILIKIRSRISRPVKKHRLRYETRPVIVTCDALS